MELRLREDFVAAACSTWPTSAGHRRRLASQAARVLLAMLPGAE